MFSYHLGCMGKPRKCRRYVCEREIGCWMLHDVAGVFLELQVYFSSCRCIHVHIIFSHSNCASPAKDPLDTVLALALFTSPWATFQLEPTVSAGMITLLKPQVPEMCAYLGRGFPFQNYLSSNRSTGQFSTESR